MPSGLALPTSSNEIKNSLLRYALFAWSSGGRFAFHTLRAENDKPLPYGSSHLPTKLLALNFHRTAHVIICQPPPPPPPGDMASLNTMYHTGISPHDPSVVGIRIVCALERSCLALI